MPPSEVRSTFPDLLSGAAALMESFRSSEAYHDLAHHHFAEGRLDEAVALLSEGLRLFPDAVDLHVGLGCAQLAREAYAWAHRAFHRALLLDPEHEDALLGYGETLFLMGQPVAGLRTLYRLLQLGFAADHELMLGAGRVLLRSGALSEAQRFFDTAYREHPDSPEAAAALGAVTHRLGLEAESLYWLRRALEIDPAWVDARIYLANILYDRGENEAALLHFLRTAPEDHTDVLGVARVIDLLRQGGSSSDEVVSALTAWLHRAALLGALDDEDPVLVEIEARQADAEPLDAGQLSLFTAGAFTIPRERSNRGGYGTHVVETLSGLTLSGTWDDLVAQLQLLDGAWASDTLREFMDACARRSLAETGVTIPTSSAEAFVRGAAEAGLVLILS